MILPLSIAAAAPAVHVVVTELRNLAANVHLTLLLIVFAATRLQMVLVQGMEDMGAVWRHL